jgi:stress response protein YsnF
MRTITAYFDSVQAAEQAAFDLATRVGGVRAKVYDARNTDSLGDLSLPEGDATTLREGFRRGGGVVHAEVPDGRFEEVADALEASGAVDLDAREAGWRKEGWAGSATSTTATAAVSPAVGTNIDASTPIASPLGATNGASSTVSGAVAGGMVERLGPADDEARIPVVEERLHVGKREAGHGRVRIRSYVVETPVQEQVTLHEERVNVERRPTDRPLTGANEALFQERTIEATETAEEAVVAKEARVVEEVALRKTAEERTETVRDTIRRTEVEVEDDRVPANTPAVTPKRDLGTV